MKYFAEIRGKEYEIVVDKEGASARLLMGGKAYHIELDDCAGSIQSARVGNRRVEFGWQRKGNCHTIIVDGVNYPVTIRDSLQRRADEVSRMSVAVKRDAEVKAPIPGLVAKVLVNAGDKVTKGAPILILSAMKLENEIASPIDGTVKSVDVANGSKVEKDQVLAVIV